MHRHVLARYFQDKITHDPVDLPLTHLDLRGLELVQRNRTIHILVRALPLPIPGLAR